VSDEKLWDESPTSRQLFSNTQHFFLNIIITASSKCNVKLYKRVDLDEQKDTILDKRTG